MTELSLSASSVDAYRRCPYRWYLTYVERQAGEGSVRQSIGLAIHKGVEAFFKPLAEAYQPPSWETPGPDDIKWLTGQAMSAHDAEFFGSAMTIPDPDEDLGKALTRSRRGLQTYLEDVAPGITPAMIEKYVTITVNGIPYTMYLDLVDTVDIIHETKTKAAKPSRPDDHAFQVVGQALGFRAETGRRETDVQLDVIVVLKRDRPYHVLVSNGGPIDNHDIGLFAATLERVADGITRNSFPPTGLENGACKWCPVRSVCEPYQEVMAR